MTLIELQISIHPPLAGRDRRSSAWRRSSTISIHPPLAGRDARLLTLASGMGPFQSTRPLRGGTAPILQRCGFETFQSTRPLRGGTDGVYQKNL